jgi:hypothetical protein
MPLSQRLRDLDQRIRHQGIFGSVRAVMASLVKTLATRSWRIK